MTEFRVLGSLDAVEDDRSLALGSPQQRALLALLLVHRRETVSVDRLIDQLWGERPPPTANKIVQGYVSNLRKVLGDGVLITRGRGYELQVAPGQTDVDRFESLVADGRTALTDGDPRAADVHLREALAMWRGPPLADFAHESFAQAEIARLEESRLAALEARIDAELEIGEHARLVGELESHVHDHPLRERFVAQLMVSLYRSGRQAEALEVYREARRRMRDELGLEPNPELRELERAILNQDPALQVPARGPAPAGPVPARHGRRGWLLVTVGAGALLVVMTVVAIRLAASGPSAVRVAPNSLAAIDPANNRIVGAAPVGARPGAVAFGAGSLWVANLDDQTISRVDPVTLATLRTIAVNGPPTGIAANGNGAWVVESSLNIDISSSSIIVGHVDPEFDTFDSIVRIGNVVPSGPGTIAAAGSSVWVAPPTGLLTRLNADTGAVEQQLDPNASPGGIAVGNGAIWLTDTEANNVVRVDSSGLLTPIPVGNGPTAVAVGAGGVWVVDSVDDALVRIDPATGSVTAMIPVGASPAGVAVGAGSVWVANSADGTVTRIDPNTDKTIATIAVGGSPQAITVADGRVWVTVDAQSITSAGGESGGGTLRVVGSGGPDYMDPALAESPIAIQLLYATCAQLLTYPDKSGQAGAQLTPEVAQSLPSRSRDGRTYTFKIRPGYRFSPPSNQPVTAQTFKDTIERTLNPAMQSPYAEDLTDIVGERPYLAGKASHVSGLLARGDELTVHLVAPAPDFVSRIAELGFCAVPSDTPINHNGVALIPSAGPYYVVSYTPGQGAVLARNPNYHGARPRRFARIEDAPGLTPKQAVDEVRDGTADYTGLVQDTTDSSSTAALVASLGRRYGSGSAAAARGAQQYFVNPAAQLDAFLLNTQRPLFHNLRLRQAVNYAIDRRALAQYGDYFLPLPEEPTDHFIPPGVPGYRDAHVYPMTPDVAKARALAGRSGRTAVLWTCDAYPCPQQAQIVKSDLAAIGIQVDIKTFPSATLFTREDRPGEPFDLAWTGWIPDYLDPAAMFNPLIIDGTAGPPMKDPFYQRRLAAADRLSGPERYLNYGELDLDLARNAAPLAAFGNLRSYDFFSARIGCQTYGVYGMDLAALCLRK